MMQPDLFDARYPDAPGSKVPGPSADAAEAMKPSAATLRAACLREFEKAGDNGLTADECAERVRETPFSIRPRVTELKALGQIHKTPRRRLNLSGMWATVLVVG